MLQKMLTLKTFCENPVHDSPLARLCAKSTICFRRQLCFGETKNVSEFLPQQTVSSRIPRVMSSNLGFKSSGYHQPRALYLTKENYASRIGTFLH